MDTKLEFSAEELVALKVGDPVAVWQGTAGGGAQVYKVRVSRVTAKQIVVTVNFKSRVTGKITPQTFRFWKKDGREVTSDIWHPAHLIKRETETK